MSVPSQSNSTPSTDRLSLLAMCIQSSRNFSRTGLAEAGKLANRLAANRTREDARTKTLGFLTTGRQGAVAIKLNCVECRGISEPTGNGGQFRSAHAGHREQDDI